MRPPGMAWRHEARIVRLPTLTTLRSGSDRHSSTAPGAAANPIRPVHLDFETLTAVTLTVNGLEADTLVGDEILMRRGRATAAQVISWGHPEECTGTTGHALACRTRPPRE